MATVRIHEQLDPGTAAAVVELWERLDTASLGTVDFITTAQEMLGYTGTTSTRQQLLLTCVDPELTAFAWATLPLSDNTALLEAEMRLMSGADPGPLLHALLSLRPTVAVWLPPGHDLSGHGFCLVQVEIASALRLPATVPEAPPAEGYVIHSWRGPVPEHHLSCVAGMKEAMSTDMPWGGQTHDREVWDGARIRETEEVDRRAGVETLWSLARHTGSGTCVGFTQLSCPAGRPAIAFQEDTLVAGGHRGHGLGMTLKVANLAQLARQLPRVRTIYTWNAEENSHMLAINRRMGFVPAARFECWQAG
ncbi:hypothetical protein EAH68_01910 [Corynebacterium hylobatis]|uniref:GNAT family N-acetyltransferase n=1 Tax=Corynebacterium hylobatis TaxID=1859290 RepID=A0A3S0B5W9_9CORY|nr:hypothetical protein [Corynebacterium hylobatis]RSZ65534.1 hypothetical protein EAH68_01910 [Corynebacterium hylobatis]